MDFRDSPEEAEFRTRLRAWLAANNPGLPASSTDDEYWARQAEWHTALYDAGFFGLSWPKRYGGQDLPPVFDVILDDFKASGKANLTAGSVTAQATNGWLSVYALIKVMRDAKATDITRATVKAAFEAAKDIPMFDLVPPWTPSKQSSNAIFKGISNPMYWTGHWDAAKKDFVVDDKQVDVIALLG